MTLEEYQQHALKTVLSSGDKFKDLVHWILGLNGEAGEVAEKLKKIIRDKNSLISDQDRAEIAKEIGDVMWHVAVLAQEIGVPLEDIAQANIDKLHSRQLRGVLGGSGDNR